MASFEIDDFDDDLTGSANCPVCGKEIDVTLDPDKNFIICPHCQSKIQIEFATD